MRFGGKAALLPLAIPAIAGLCIGRGTRHSASVAQYVPLLSAKLRK